MISTSSTLNYYCPLPTEQRFRRLITSKASSIGLSTVKSYHGRPGLHTAGMKRQKTVCSTMSGSTSMADSMHVHHVSGLRLERGSVVVPLDYSGVLEGDITIFYRVVTSRCKNAKNLPYLVYLQGGPGFEAPRPMLANGWIKSAVQHYQVVLMDQRGTGLSHAITCDGLKARDASEQVDYLSCFRADSIAKDCERVRQKLALSGKWSVIGQSYGGFCAMTYLSYFPDSIMEVFLTGGVPPGIRMNCSAEMVYKSTFRKAIKQNEKFYARFPQAVAMAQKVVRFLMSSPDGRVVTPASNYLTPRSFQVLGINCLGFSSGFERLYYMLESAFDIDGNLSYKFLKEFDAAMPWDSNPLYAIMHENIYCQGNSSSEWAAHRVRGEYSALFDAEASVTAGNPVYFTGEMVFPWMFDDFAELRKIKQAAHAMATHTNWSTLYLPETLSANTVPIAAACYYEDMFVSFELAQETLDMVGSARQYVTNDYLHDGIREQGGPIFEKLLNIVRGGALLR